MRTEDAGMTQPKELDPYTSARAFYGAELRRLREQAGLSQDQLGERVFCSGTYVGQFESAVRRPQTDVSRLFDDVLGGGEHLQRLCRLARQSKHPDYFADAAELEKLATTISEYAPMLVPGLLQTEAYARALTRATLPFAPDDEVEEHVSARMERGCRIDRPGAPEVWAIIHEAALRVPVDGPEVMREQIDRLWELSRSHSRVVVQIVPFDAGPHPLMYGTTILMTSAESAPVAYTEGAHTGQLIDEPPMVAKFQRSYDHVRAAALSPKASLPVLASAVKDYSTP
ncbi:transcriptional regulator [Streptomyces daqingensis]|uniref:Transcriptional regulator n=2 Tax=Streptomyces daqingensis TaxID=1472640 RepID=A0ABQ2MW96_9ACTN|nr:transcriptional regulator [Streptomyces daqingensis]